MVLAGGGTLGGAKAKPLPRSAFADLLALWPRPKWGVWHALARSFAPTKVGGVALATARAPKGRAPAAFFFFGEKGRGRTR